MKDIEAERFFADLQEHIEDVTTFYIPTQELERVVADLLMDGHRTLPTRASDGMELAEVSNE